MQTINLTIANLQTQMLSLDATIAANNPILLESIYTSKELLLKAKEIYKAYNNNLLLDFATANIILLGEIAKINKMNDIEQISLENARVIMIHITTAYQEIIVPMLTKIHNLSADEDMPKITAITALGNEVITYSAQINQFASKFDTLEKIFTMLGVVLMLNSICMMIIILSKNPHDLSMLTCLTIMALGCCLYHRAMLAHKEDPSTDIITASVKKMEPLIYDIAKKYQEDPILLQEIIYGVKNISSEQTAVSEEPITSHSILDKVKNVLDIFNKK